MRQSILPSRVAAVTQGYADRLVQHWQVLLILCVTVLMRLPYLSIVGHNDLTYFYQRAIAIDEQGLWPIYAQNDGRDFNYPPLYFMALALMNTVWSPSGSLAAVDPTFLHWHKLFQVAADMLLIGITYTWLVHKRRLRWIIPGLLAVFPGMIITSAFWGQTDTLWTLFLVLALIGLNRDHPKIAWIGMTLAVLTKFQAVFVFPLLVILTFRRYGWRTTLIGLGLSLAIFVGVLAPFMLAAGVEPVLRPFTLAVNFFPTTTVWALNLWYGVNPMVWGEKPPLLYDTVSDATLLLGPLTNKQMGLLLLSLYTLLLGLIAWRQYRERREFVWAAALGFGFFMLPTEIHERYLLPAAIFLLVGIAQDWRLWPLALATFFTYSYNVILPTQAPFYFLGINPLFFLGDMTLHVTLFHLFLLIYVTRVAISNPSASTVDWGAFSRPIRAYFKDRMRRPVWLMSGIFVSALAVAVLARIFVPDSLPTDITPLNAQFANGIQLEGYRITQHSNALMVNLYWRALAYHNDDYTVFVHAVQDGATIAQCDGRPQNGAYPTWRWFNNRLVETQCVLNLPENAAPDTLYAGLYDAQMMVNAPLIQNGQPVPSGRAVIGESAP